MKIHHVAYAVTSIEKSKIKFEELGFEVAEPEMAGMESLSRKESVEANLEKSEAEMDSDNGIVEDTFRNIKILFMMHKESQLLIELVEPLNASSPITNLCQKMHGSASPYHICYEVENINDTIAELKKKGYLVTQKPEPAVAIEGRMVAFLFQKDAGIIELVEKL